MQYKIASEGSSPDVPMLSASIASVSPRYVCSFLASTADFSTPIVCVVCSMRCAKDEHATQCRRIGWALCICKREKKKGVFSVGQRIATISGVITSLSTRVLASGRLGTSKSLTIRYSFDNGHTAILDYQRHVDHRLVLLLSARRLLLISSPATLGSDLARVQPFQRLRSVSGALNAAPLTLCAARPSSIANAPLLGAFPARFVFRLGSGHNFHIGAPGRRCCCGN